MNYCKMRAFQQKPPVDVASQYVHGDTGIPPTYSPSKKKKNGGPDPRFRRVIVNPDYRSEKDLETDKLVQEEREMDEKVVSFLKIPKETSFFTASRISEGNANNNNNKADMSNEVTKDTGFQISRKYHHGTYENGDLDKVRSGTVANLKRSASDCTLNKTKAFAEENDEETAENVRGYPSVTRLAKVHNWMKGYSVFPEKRRSVITVIGQTQTKPFSKILSEINQRRKLAKELDRHALCEAIMESAESQPNVKNLVAKVDLVLPDGKVIYSAEKVYLRRDNKFAEAGSYTHQSTETLDSGDQKKKSFQMIPERDLSGSQLGRKSRMKRLSKKTGLCLKEKDETKRTWSSMSSMLIWSFLVVLCLSLAFSFFFYSVKPSQTYSLVGFFKPKTAPWYEKLLF